MAKDTLKKTEGVREYYKVYQQYYQSMITT